MVHTACAARRPSNRRGDYISAPAVLGNAEGSSMDALAKRDLIATLVTDDNFLPATDAVDRVSPDARYGDGCLTQPAREKALYTADHQAAYAP
jgi:hypothetical protein